MNSHELSEKNIMQEEADAGIEEKDLNAGRSQRDIEEVSGKTKDGIPILVVAALAYGSMCLFWKAALDLSWASKTMQEKRNFMRGCL